MIDLQLLSYLEGFLTKQRKQRFLQVLEKRSRFITVAIEDVYQLHNTSAVVRSCEVFGVQEAHVIENRFGKRLDENIAMGAQQWVDIQRHATTADCIAALRQRGYLIIATTPHNDSSLLQDFKVDRKTALFFGTEKEGLSAEVLQAADGFLKIPMMGFTASLNISVSAAIILQKLSTQLRDSDLDWQLSETDKQEIRLEWAKRSIKSIDDILTRYLKGN